MSRAIGVMVVLTMLCGTALALPPAVGNMSSLMGSVSLTASANPLSLQDGLVARWKFDETSGTTAYDSTGKHNGILYGPKRALGVFGGGLSFDGIDDWVEVPYSEDFDMTHEMAIAGWICHLKSEDAVILCKQPSFRNCEGYPGNYEFGVTSAGCVQLLHETGSGWGLFIDYTSSRRISVGDWHHVCVTLRAGDFVKFYIDGAEAGSSAQSATFGLVNGQPIRIGKHKYTALTWPTSNQNLPLCFYGYMDDFYLYNRVLSPEEVKYLYIYTASPTNDYFVNGKIGDDSNYGTRRDQPFATIQKGIDAAKDGDTVRVYPGVYTGAVSFKGKAITVASVEDAAIIESPDAIGVSFESTEGPNSVLKNFVIRNATTGVFITGGSPTLKNLTITSCGTGIQSVDGQPQVTNCILWNNADADLIGCGARYSCIQRAASGTGNLSTDPLFADPNSGDYHLCSQRGQYWLRYGLWVLGDVTSPCIDAGDPADDDSLEQQPNGGRIDMGAHGGTPYASRSMKKP